jgi:hypothetical protein
MAAMTVASRRLCLLGRVEAANLRVQLAWGR